MSDALSQEAQAAIEKVEKLLRLASKNPNEAEAAAATAKAMEILATFNLDMSAVEQHGGGTGKRADEQLAGGFYEWQRSLWDAVAELNFCMYWNQIAFIEFPGGKIERIVRDKEYQARTGNSHRMAKGINQHQHRVVGRTVNIAATKAMATYLEMAVERIVAERCSAGKISRRSPFAVSYREGLTDGLVQRIYARRRHLIAEEEQKRRDAEAEAIAAGRAGVSTATAVTLTSYVKSEADANIDFRFGEGTAAHWAAERAKRAEEKRLAEENYTKWAAANPEKARKAEEKRIAEKERRQERERKRNVKYVKDISAYYAGQDASEKVSLDQQAETFKPAGVL